MKIQIVKQRKQIIGALIVGLIAALVIVLGSGGMDWTLPFIAVLALGFGAIAVVTLCLRVRITGRPGMVLFHLVAASAAIVLLHLSVVGRISIKSYISDLCIILGIQLLLQAVTGRLKAPAIIWLTVCCIYGLINQAVMQFRGTLITLNDFTSIKTAINVAGNYHLKINLPILMTLFVYACALFQMITCRVECKHPTGLRSRILALVLAVVLPAIPISQIERYNCYFWSTKGIRYNGFFMQYLLEYDSTKIATPEDYSAETAAAALQEYPLQQSPEKKPHIIVVMNEAFSDLSVLGDLQTSEDVIPYYNSFKQEALHGHALASVYGGNTANSEWEFLSGNTMGFLSASSVPYLLYVDENSPMLMDTLSAQGYRCVAMHPFYSDGWERKHIYPMMGFDETYFLEDLDWGDIVREYISDEAFVDQIIARFEAQDPDEPLFLFGITMQNHGSYFEEWESTVKLQGMKGSYPDVEQYLSLIRLSDLALEKLISYFKEVDEPVVIVGFGDHQPKLDTNFYSELGAKDQRLAAVVPFFIWNNYGIEAREIPVTSLNYLSAMMLETAGLPLPPYQQFLLEMQQQLPAINSQGWVDADHNSGTIAKAQGETADLLARYRALQYANMFDDGVDPAFFTGSVQ